MGKQRNTQTRAWANIQRHTHIQTQRTWCSAAPPACLVLLHIDTFCDVTLPGGCSTEGLWARTAQEPKRSKTQTKPYSPWQQCYRNKTISTQYTISFLINAIRTKWHNNLYVKLLTSFRSKHIRCEYCHTGVTCHKCWREWRPEAWGGPHLVSMVVSRLRVDWRSRVGHHDRGPRHRSRLKNTHTQPDEKNVTWWCTDIKSVYLGVQHL